MTLSTQPDNKCNICPRRCNIDRTHNKGYCLMNDKIMAARAALHMWEEPCISGERGSGAIFFSGCTLRCVFCQNHDIASAKVGKELSVDELSDVMLRLQDNKADNINLVTPTHFTIPIIKAIEKARNKGLAITILLYVISYSNVILILGLLIAVFMYFSSSLGYKVGKAQVSREVQAEFADWIMEVALRIQFSNVVAAIADSYDTAPDILKPEIEKLLTELGETPTSPEPYNNFCKFFNFEDIGIVMNTLYSVMSASGSDVDKELSTIFSQNRKQANTVSEQQRKNKDARNKLYCYWEILACCALLLTDMAFYALYFIDGITSII